MGLAILLLVQAALPATSTASPALYLPCTPGLTIEYAPTGGRQRTETVRGAGALPSTCVIDRETRGEDGKVEHEAWLREILPDRISNAGWADQPVAFRTPMLKAPLEAGRRWHFNTTDFVIRAVGERVSVAAGVFDGCVRVDERTADGKHAVSSVYAPGVGLILAESPGGRLEAARVGKPGKVGAKAGSRQVSGREREHKR